MHVCKSPYKESNKGKRYFFWCWSFKQERTILTAKTFNNFLQILSLLIIIGLTLAKDSSSWIINFSLSLTPFSLTFFVSSWRERLLRSRMLSFCESLYNWRIFSKSVFNLPFSSFEYCNKFVNVWKCNWSKVHFESIGIWYIAYNLHSVQKGIWTLPFYIWLKGAPSQKIFRINNFVYISEHKKTRQW